MLDALEDLRHRNQFRKYGALVDQIRQAAGARLGPELGPGIVAFLFPQRFHALAKLGEQRRRYEARQYKVAQFIELPFVALYEHGGLIRAIFCDRSTFVAGTQAAT